MAAHQQRRLPVVSDEGRLVGALAQADVAQARRALAAGEREAEDPWRQHRERVEAPLREQGVEHELVTSLGPADDDLVAQAEQYAADLLVVGTREPGFLQRLLTGSVSAGVARKAHCDVLVVHPDDDSLLHREPQDARAAR
jgi:nucleotide-binding universal stress UspA family protein